MHIQGDKDGDKVVSDVIIISNLIADSLYCSYTIYRSDPPRSDLFTECSTKNNNN